LYSIKKPIWAGALIILRLLVFMIFFSYIGSILFGLAGLFAGMALAEVLSACVSYMFYSKALLEIKKSVA
jgi:Na+-driven multidrug efflux pump